MPISLKIVLFTLVIILLGSCTIEKRVHNKGYNIQWKNKNYQTVEGESANSVAAELDGNDVYVDLDVAVIEKFENTIITTQALPFEEEISNNIVSSEKSNAPKEQIVKTIVYNANRFNIKRSNNITEYQDNQETANALNGIGWVLIILGILFLLVISIGLGIVFMLVGLLFVVAGKK